MDKANEYAVEALKQIITLAGAILALTITFLKDALGDAREHAKLLWLVPAGWLFLIVSILLAWYALAEVANCLGTQQPPNTQVFAFARQEANPKKLFRTILTPLAWFVFFLPTNEVNVTRKLAASAQHYFFIGLVLLGLFTFINLSVTPSKTPPPPPSPTPSASPQIEPSPQPSPAVSKSPKRRARPCKASINH